MTMQIEVQQNGNRLAVVRLIGRLDLLSAASLKQRLAQEVAEGRQHIIVDLIDVEFIDSSGLGALIGGLKAARVAGGDLRIARPREQARTVLRLTTLDRVLRGYETVEEAAVDYA
jgi:anti-anti-sigma factor